MGLAMGRPGRGPQRATTSAKGLRRDEVAGAGAEGAQSRWRPDQADLGQGRPGGPREFKLGRATCSTRQMPRRNPAPSQPKALPLRLPLWRGGGTWGVRSPELGGWDLSLA